MNSNQSGVGSAPRLPAHLYKYRRFNEETISIIVNSAIYFAKADDFNDPFDCKVRFNYEGTDEEWRTALTQMLTQHHPELSIEVICRMVDSKMKEGGHRDLKLLESAEDYARRGQIDSKGILCLTASPTNILMWSHYADNHNGCCLEFSTTTRIFKDAEPVDYAPEYPKVRYLDSFGKPDIHARLTLRTKSILWSYEEEWRVLSSKGPDLYKYDKDSLTGVICGYWMKPENADLIRNLVKDRTPKIALYRAIPEERRFGMKLLPID